MTREWEFRSGAKTLVRTAFWLCGCNVLAALLAAQCSNPTEVPDQNITSGNASYTDTNALAATNFVVSDSGSVTFVAGGCIDLGPGFHAAAGTAPMAFHAWVGTYTTTGTVANPTFSPAAAPLRGSDRP